jgi:protein-L-isoaspartate(D-aspartate) O-methyltransferase
MNVSSRDFFNRKQGNYAPRSYYEDSPQPIGYKATISAPHMHASALEHLSPFVMVSK